MFFPLSNVTIADVRKQYMVTMFKYVDQRLCAQGCLSKAVLLKAVNNVHNVNNVHKLIMFIS